MAATISTIPAHGAADAAPPILTLPPNASFVQNTTIGSMLPDADGYSWTSGITMRAKWSASDASNICGYRYREIHAGWAPNPWPAWGSATSVTTGTWDYDDQFGGGSDKFMGYAVQVRDCAGNITEKFVAFLPQVFQEDGGSFGYGTLPVSYTGTWATSNCECFSGGMTRRTTAAGARVTFQIDSGAERPIALVVESAPNRGRAEIWIDGVKRTTIDTYSAITTHRKVVWLGTLRTSGTHTLQVRNVGTPGRPRIDIDAVLLSNWA